MDSLVKSYSSNMLLAARILIALMFMESCADKVLHWNFYMMEMVNKHIPLPTLALAAAVLVEFLGSIALLTGIALPAGTLALAGYTFIVSFFYFDFWNQADIAAIMARKEFLKNLAVVGGLLAFTAIGRNTDTVQAPRGHK